MKQIFHSTDLKVGDIIVYEDNIIFRIDSISSGIVQSTNMTYDMAVNWKVTDYLIRSYLPNEEEKFKIMMEM